MSTSTATCLRCGGTFTQVDPDDELCAACIQVVITDVEPRVTTYEEWRVTGDPVDGFGPSFEFVFSELREPDCTEPERDARRLLTQVKAASPWADSARLSKRTVTVSEWEAQA